MKNVFQARKHLLQGLALSLALGLTTAVEAKSSSGGRSSGSDTPPVDSGFFIGGGITFDAPNHGDASSLVTYRLGLGYQFSPQFAVEYDYTEPADNQDGYKDGYQYLNKTGTSYNKGYYEYRTQSLYGIYRTPGSVYFKTKLGATLKDYDSAPSNKAVNDGSGLGPSGGIGIGVRDGHGMLELEYTAIQSDFVNISSYSLTAYMLF